MRLKTNITSVVITCLTLLGFVSNCIAQSRVNRSIIEYTSSSIIFKNSIGWSYNDDLGEWIDFRNFISREKKYKTEWKSLTLNGYAQSMAWQNFETIQFKKLNYPNQTYYILIVSKWEGEWEYPSIPDNWEYWKEYNAYVFKEDEFKKFQQLDLIETGDVELKSTIKISMGRTYEKYNREVFDKLIQAAIEKENTTISSEYLFYIRKIVDEKTKKIRFLLPQERSILKRFLLDLETNYFECVAEEFEKLIIK